MDALKQDYIHFDEYLAQERDVEVRSEYVDGQVYAMAGASELHNTIAATLFIMIGNTLSEACFPWQSDMKVIGERQGKYFSYYPDIMVACGENTGDQYVRTNPVLIVEVLSPSTQRTDLKEKFDNYTAISSLLEYAVVSQEVPLLRVFRRRTAWQLETYYADDTFVLESIDLTAQVKKVYRRVKLDVGLEVRIPQVDK